ncbi:uncharacterized protein PSFLO_03839 [Pseudozyma flocculosa]|nr:uncharacterized protein PSFLO_03839 [Pseudozyma flocculosa]
MALELPNFRSAPDLTYATQRGSIHSVGESSSDADSHLAHNGATAARPTLDVVEHQVILAKSTADYVWTLSRAYRHIMYGRKISYAAEPLREAVLDYIKARMRRDFRFYHPASDLSAIDRVMFLRPEDRPAPDSLYSFRLKTSFQPAVKRREPAPALQWRNWARADERTFTLGSFRFKVAKASVAHDPDGYTLLTVIAWPEREETFYDRIWVGELVVPQRLLQPADFQTGAA